MRHVSALLVCAGICLMGVNQIYAEGWGHLKGKIVVEGNVTPAAKLTVDKDVAVCGPIGLVDESIVVGPGGGLQNAFVFMYLKFGAEPPAVHPDYDKTAGDTLVLDNIKCRFEPHAMAIRTGQTLKVKNSDPIGHNAKIDSFNNQKNPNIPAGAFVDLSFDKADRVPAIVSCSSHPWMQAKILIRDEPYFAVTNANGEFEIKNIPEGKWSFQFWQEKTGYLTDATIDGKSVLGRRGEMEVEIKDGEATDLGVFTITAAKLEED